MRDKSEIHWAALHFTIANALGYCEPEAERRFLDEFPGMSVEEKDVALLGCKQAINSALESSSEWTVSLRRNLSGALEKRKLPSVETLLTELDKKKARILKRGRLVDEEESYLASDLLANPRAKLTSSQKEKWARMLALYESAVRR